jgi:L-amino acid N-acyltransferase YncA
MELQYRLAELADLPRLVEINIGDEKEYQEINEKMFAEIIPQKQVLCVLAEGNIIGLLYWRKEFFDRAAMWYFEQISIDKAYRGKGIGLALLKHFLELAKKEGIKKIFSFIHNDNYPSLKMHLNAGGLISGTIEGLGETEGKDERVLVRFELS